MVKDKGNATQFINDIINDIKRKDRIQASVMYHILNAYPNKELEEMKSIMSNHQVYKTLSQEEIDKLVTIAPKNNIVLYYINRHTNYKLTKKQLDDLITKTAQNKKVNEMLIRKDLSDEQIDKVILLNNEKGQDLKICIENNEVSQQILLYIIKNAPISTLSNLEYLPFFRILTSNMDILNSVKERVANLETITFGGFSDSFFPGYINSCVKLSTINYTGTKTEFNRMLNSAYNSWNSGMSEITVHCTDGDIVIPANN